MDTDLNETCFTHQPVRPVREDVMAEVVFMAKWQLLMEKQLADDEIDPPNQMLKAILWTLPIHPTERHSQVCASLIRWLGTNNGRAFLERADECSVRLRSRADGYVLAWALENQRRPSTDWGWRTIEAVLCTESLSRPGIKRPTLSHEDTETLEVLMAWLGSEAGEAFIIDCRKEIEKRLRQNREALRERHAQSLSVSL